MDDDDDGTKSFTLSWVFLQRFSSSFSLCRAYNSNRIEGTTAKVEGSELFAAGQSREVV